MQICYQIWSYVVHYFSNKVTNTNKTKLIKFVEYEVEEFWSSYYGSTIKQLKLGIGLNLTRNMMSLVNITFAKLIEYGISNAIHIIYYIRTKFKDKT